MEDRPTLEYTSDKSQVMICGGISRKGVTDLYFWRISEDGGINAEDSKDCLNEILLNRMNGLYGYGKWRMVHDNARIHTAYLTQNLLEENGVRRISHPPYSPDLNPIERVWGYLKKKRVMTKAYESIDELIEAITEISLQIINNYIDGHIRRIKAVLEAEGGIPINS